MKFAVVILAGGRGSRIGGDKPSKLLGGRPLIDRAEEFARQWSDTVAAAVRSQGQLRGSGLTGLLDATGIDGPLAGLAAALRFCFDQGYEAVLTIPADMPFLPPDLPTRLAAEIGDAWAAVASSGGHLHPVCALWRVSALDALPAYLATGARSLRGFAKAASFRAVDWADAPVDPFFNINSVEDLATAQRLLGG